MFLSFSLVTFLVFSTSNNVHCMLMFSCRAASGRMSDSHASQQEGESQMKQARSLPPIFALFCFPTSLICANTSLKSPPLPPVQLITFVTSTSTRRSSHSCTIRPRFRGQCVNQVSECSASAMFRQTKRQVEEVAVRLPKYIELQERF